MSESDGKAHARSRQISRAIFIVLGIAAGVALLGTIAAVVTICVKYDSLHDAAKKGDRLAVWCFLLRGADVNAKKDGALG